MSLILLGLSTLEENNDQVPICNLPIRNATCGGNFSCHFKPDVDQILEGLGLQANEDVKASFAMPQKWFCSEFTFFSLWHIREKAKQEQKEETGLEMFFGRQDNNAKKSKTERLIYDIEEGTIEGDIYTKESIEDMFTYLEKKDFRCYYSLTKPYTSEGEDSPNGFQMLICYQQDNDNLEPNKNIKVIFDIVYYLDGNVDIIDWVISKDEERTFEKIVEFDKQ